MAKTISVIIPAYNAAIFICDALNSIAKQVLKPSEIVVVDDGSADNTSNVVEKWIEDHIDINIPVKLLRQENKGVSAARNTGINNASSELIALLDADDMFLPEHLKLLSDAIKIDDNIVLSFGNAQVLKANQIINNDYFNNKRIKNLRFNATHSNAKIICDSVFQKLIYGNFIPCCSVLFKKEQAIKIGLFDESLFRTEDRDFFLRLSRLGQFVYYEQPISIIRRHDNNISHIKYNSINLFNGFKLVQKMLMNKSQLNLDSYELKEALLAKRETLIALLYDASNNGFKSYMQTVIMLLKNQTFEIFFYPNFLVKSLFRSHEKPL